MITLYIITGSKHSSQAVTIVESVYPNYNLINVSDNQLTALYRDLGIRELPTLVTQNTRYVGLAEIQRFIGGGSGNIVQT